ncbi:PilW family protein [Leeia aquatica]|uniref:Prepilin-type N-terminal cleavage/methylation domain-containing protein n=1 Tax=Leeia aquatica TaxID=2725557 RepID=A0A847RYB1_9NEIS|nr:PilW family protein [Leeia aquatica]NLR74711.1 prepilin-type N-terminal cleavage/methylation domain-containing protein [Leeia aquatica]
MRGADMKQRAQQFGFSLVELMVSLTLGSLVILALGQIYSSTSASRRVQEMQSRLAEDGRFVMGISSRLLLQAGYKQNPGYGSAPFQSVSGAVSTASSVAIVFDADGINQVGCNGVAVASEVNLRVTIFQSGSGLDCRFTNASGSTITNWVVAAASGTSRGVEVVDFNLQYGIDDNVSTVASAYQCAPSRDCIPDRYTSTPGTGARIVAVRVCAVLRSEQSAMAVSRPAAFTNCTGANIAASTTDRKVYRIFRTTVAMRNRS